MITLEIMVTSGYSGKKKKSFCTQVYILFEKFTELKYLLTDFGVWSGVIIDYFLVILKSVEVCHEG